MSKNFRFNGKWIDNPNTPAVVICKCGGKYIKTRVDQTMCLACMSEARAAKS